MTQTEVYSGHFFDFANPRPEDIRIEDIAHALSMMCRFNGHTEHFYSVAEHSYITAIACPDEYKLWGLLHDAAEAYIGDMNAPLKKMVEGTYKEVERDVEQCIVEKFGLSPDTMPEEVHEADMEVLSMEKEQVIQSDHEWEATKGIRTPAYLPYFWVPRKAKRKFLERFKVLS